MVNNIVGGTRYTGCLLHKKKTKTKAVVRRDKRMYNLTQQINMNVHMKIMVF